MLDYFASHQLTACLQQLLVFSVAFTYDCRILSERGKMIILLCIISHPPPPSSPPPQPSTPPHPNPPKPVAEASKIHSSAFTQEGAHLLLFPPHWVARSSGYIFPSKLNSPEAKHDVSILLWWSWCYATSSQLLVHGTLLVHSSSCTHLLVKPYSRV